MRFSSLSVSATLLAGLAFAHPGHDVRQEAAERAAALSTVSKRDLSHCAEKLKRDGVEQRAIARRSAMAQHLRKKRSLAAGKLRI